MPIRTQKKIVSIGLSTFLLLAPLCIVWAQTQRARRVAQKPAPEKTSIPKPANPPVKTAPAPAEAPKKSADVVKTESKEDDDGPVLKIESKLIAVPVSVTDGNGNPVKGLSPDDFRLEEEGAPQQLVTLGEPGKTPVELSLVFDVSGSVYERFKFQQDAAARFLGQVLKPSDAVSLFSIGMSSKLEQERTVSFEQVLSGLTRIVPTKEGTAFFDTIGEAAKYIGKTAAAGTRHVIVVISDGEDNKSDRYRLADVAQELQRNDCLFYAINPSGPSIRLNRVSMKGNDGMVHLAKQTGGYSFLPEKFEDLESVFKQIAAELQAQYLLGYYSTDERTDGGFRKIAVHVPKRPELRVRARQGYFAPKA